MTDIRTDSQQMFETQVALRTGAEAEGGKSVSYDGESTLTAVDTSKETYEKAETSFDGWSTMLLADADNMAAADSAFQALDDQLSKAMNLAGGK